MIKLFDIENGKVKATEHCYILKSLKVIMDKYPDNYLKIYQYLFYMTCPNQEANPFFNLIEEEKEQAILQEIQADFSVEDQEIIEAKDRCEELYETPTLRAYNGMAKMIDRLAEYMANTEISHGRDGNINSIVAAAKNFDGIRSSFKGIAKDLQEEQRTKTRGNQGIGYDL